MYIYNVTIKIDSGIESEWVAWMQQEHLDEVIATGMFDTYNFLELLEPAEDDSKTYIAQYFTDSKTRYEQYIQQYAPLIRQKGYEKFGDRFIAFRTILRQLM